MSEGNGNNRRNLIVVVVGVVVAAVVAVMLLRDTEEKPSLIESVLAQREAALASEFAPTYGDAGAKVHLVEFLDPACGACAVFYPMVKSWMGQVPGQIRLSVRHVPFHTNADYAVKVLEASRKQGKYWETLEALLASQAEWTQNHIVITERIAPAIAGVGLDMEQLEADMNSVEVLRNMEQDQKDAVFLKVSKTPTYFVNGRELPSFGPEQLATLIREELEK